MKKTSAANVIAYRSRQSRQGRRLRHPYLTDDEWLKVKEFIKSIRGE